MTATTALGNFRPHCNLTGPSPSVADPSVITWCVTVCRTIITPAIYWTPPAYRRRSGCSNPTGPHISGLKTRSQQATQPIYTQDRLCSQVSVALWSLARQLTLKISFSVLLHCQCGGGIFLPESGPRLCTTCPSFPGNILPPPCSQHPHRIGEPYMSQQGESIDATD